MATINISLPDKLVKEIDRRAKTEGYATRSEFVRDIVREKVSPAEPFQFRQFVPRPLEEIRRGLEATGKYNKKFIHSVIEGLRRSSFYDGQASQQ